MPTTVYLAGLISTEFPESLAWRERVGKAALVEAGFIVRSPLRGKTDLVSTTPDGGITSLTRPRKTILLRDRADVREADVILVHLESFGSTRPLVGTIAELAWAFDDQTPVVAICHPDNYLMRNHPFIAEFVSAYFPTEESAAEYITSYFV